MAVFHLRHPDLAVAAHGHRCVFVLPASGAPFVVEPCDAAAISRLLARLAAPCSLDALEAEGHDLRLLTLLVARGFVLSGKDEASLASRLPAPTSPRRIDHLVFGVSGAVGAVNVVGLVSHFQRHIAKRVDVVLTASATRMLRPEVFGYLGITPFVDPFASTAGAPVPHIALAGADLVVVAPASAHTLFKIAHGTCEDLLSLVVAATRAPVVVAPSMNPAMWENPAIVANVDRLRSRGVWILEPTSGIEASRAGEATYEHGAAALDPETWTPLLHAILAKD